MSAAGHMHHRYHQQQQQHHPESTYHQNNSIILTTGWGMVVRQIEHMEKGNKFSLRKTWLLVMRVSYTWLYKDKIHPRSPYVASSITQMTEVSDVRCQCEISYGATEVNDTLKTFSIQEYVTYVVKVHEPDQGTSQLTAFYSTYLTEVWNQQWILLFDGI